MGESCKCQDDECKAESAMSFTLEAGTLAGRDRGRLCPLGGLKAMPTQLMPMTSTGITWEKVTLTVDSGASDTVIPPSCLSWAEMRHTNKVGTEYEVANGEIVHNLGARRCIMRMGEKQPELDIEFQVVEDVHKPLLAVSSIVEQGHSVVFAKKEPHILLTSGEKLMMRNCNGTYEIDIWVKNPGFARQSGR